MERLEVSYDTLQFEVPCEWDKNGVLTEECASHSRRLLDEQGFVIIPHLLSDEEAATGLRIVREILTDPNREPGTFASQTDLKYRRRDFCPLPSTEPVLTYAAVLCQRMVGILTEYCGKTRPVLEISTLTSNLGSSHQYIHRDPYGVICMFVALDDVSRSQGGTVFVPGTHSYTGSEWNLNGRARMFMDLYQTLCNIRILSHNLSALRRMRKAHDPSITWQEFRERIFSKCWDNHQPNLLRFFLGKNRVFDVRRLGPRTLLRLIRHRKRLERIYRLVQVAPRRGAAIIYRSDVLHAGSDNRSIRPRYFFAVNISRDVISPMQWRDGYSPHSSLLSEPLTLGDLLVRKPEPTHDTRAP